ncbi:hypothetical protein [Clostridium saccharobutylicum]|uniref:Uncharacterized protein n=1 Tax=Clostridium saccharobutylicum TaxID=169679 RepID=A0A1S8MY85_CLOSA|nr:hypothetical protein [Clostridium saccharobutylicum]OOM09115.1 hypothetical protein CLOSAC_33950 [Clostridium saccharobutylicum]
MKTISLENSKINKLEVLTSIPTEIKVSGSTTIDSLDIKLVATNFDGNRVKLTGDFEDTQIQVGSSIDIMLLEVRYLENSNGNVNEIVSPGNNSVTFISLENIINLLSILKA